MNFHMVTLSKQNYTVTMTFTEMQGYNYTNFKLDLLYKSYTSLQKSQDDLFSGISKNW